MKNNVVAGWLFGLTLGVISLLVVTVSNSYDSNWSTLLGLTMIAQLVFAVIAANRLSKIS